MEYLDKGIKPEDIVTFDRLMRDSHDDAIFSGEEPNTFDNKYEVMKIIDSGYDTLPQIYHNVFLDPLSKLIQTEKFDTIKEIYTDSGVFDDWLLCLTQRENAERQDLALATNAMEEFIADLFDGNLSDTARKGAKLPAQLVSPLTKWGSDSPYTWGSKMGARFGMNMPILSMPINYSSNVLFWVLGGHECYHSVVDAYGKDLLNELEDLITDEFDRKNKSKSKESLDEGQLDEVQKWRQEIQWNNDNNTLAEFASIYWRSIMNETVADIGSLLNLGPSAGIAFAVLAITLNQNRLNPESEIDDPHPNPLLRIKLAKEFTKRLVWLNYDVRKNYIGFFDKLIDKYAPEEKNFTLYTREVESGKKIIEVQIPIESMTNTIEVVVDKIAHTRLKTLGNHSMAEINTWTNSDELIANVAADYFMKNEVLNFNSDYFDKHQVYAAHIVAGATVALTKKPEIRPITKLAIKHLNELHDNNPVWKGFPVSFRSDAEKADGLYETRKWNENK
jgi:hypothetical protein